MYRAARASLRRRLLASSVWVLACASALPAAAAPDTVAVDVAAGTLDSALATLATQTRQQVLYTADLVANRKAPALKGAYTPDEALSRLLAGSGIVAKRTGPNVVVLQGAPPSRRQPIARSAASRPFGDDAAVAIATADPASAGSPTTVGELTVTGSNIRGVPPASPLRVLDQTLLQRSGHVTLAEALRALPENFAGGANEGNNLTGADGVGRNTAYGSALNLRGLGNGATLVLLNGHRVAGSGTFADFVDISTIPTTAVERVEVLLDGASAVYGSDAVGGVVNIILKRDFDGQKVQVLVGGGADGEPLQARVAATLGRRWDGGGLVFSYELQRRDALRTADREFTRTSDLRPLGGSDFRVTNAFPGNILRPDPVTGQQVIGWAIPSGQPGTGLRPSDFQPGSINLQNQRVGADILPRQTTNSAYLSLNQAMGEVRLFADARYAYRRFKAYLTPVVSTLSVGRANPFFVSPNGSATHTIAYNWAYDLGNPNTQGSVETAGVSVSAKIGLFADWQAEAYATYDQEITETRGFGFINSLILGEALGNGADRIDTAYSAGRDGFFNPFNGIPGGNNANVAAAIGSGRTWSRARSRIGTLNVRADGALIQLPGGTVRLAVGASARREDFFRGGANLLATASPTPIAVSDAARDVAAGFAEARIPLFGPDNARPGLKKLEVSLAGRVERYELAGTTANPSMGVLWEPTGGLQVRGTFSRSFRAPALREMFDTATVSPTLLSRGAVRVRTLQLNGGNPDLDPETATSWTAGFDLTPSRWPDLNLSATLYDVRFKNRIDRPAATNLANSLTDLTLTPFVQLISPATNPADLATITAALASAPFTSITGTFPANEYGAIVDTRFVNTTTLHVRGIDASVSYAFDISGEDRVSVGGSFSYLFDYEQQFTPTSRVVDTVNIANFPLRFRGRATADWTRGRASLAVAANYTGRYRDSNDQRIGDFVSFDLQARLAPADSGVMKDIAVLFNVRNVFDRHPPFYNNSQGFGYDPANADPIGRFVSLQLTRAW